MYGCRIRVIDDKQWTEGTRKQDSRGDGGDCGSMGGDDRGIDKIGFGIGWNGEADGTE